LQELGITSIFDAKKVDFSPILGRQPAEVGEVKHAVELEVDENGVEGAAATGVSVVSRTMRQPQVIKVNKPFYFIISNVCQKQNSRKKENCPKGNIPIFTGRVIDPTK